MDYFEQIISRAEQKFANSKGFTPRQMGAPIGHICQNSVFFTETEEKWVLLKQQLEIRENLRYLTTGVILFSSAIIVCSLLAMIVFPVRECLIVGGASLVAYVLFYLSRRVKMQKELKKLRKLFPIKFYEVPMPS